MSFTKLLFKLIDIFGYIPQNSYHNKNSVIMAKNVVYCDTNPKQCTLDLWSDKSKTQTKLPIFINLHGGGFVAGDKKYRKSFTQYCLKFNVKVLNINYGLAPKRNLLEILKELTCLFDWIKNNKDKYNLDSDKIILCGDSAGAYLATCLLALSTNTEYANEINLSKIDTNIAGLILFSGIYYPTDSLDKKMILKINHSLWSYLSGEKFVDFESCKKHNLFKIINVADFLTSNKPPTFISYSTTDIFCKGNGEKLVEKLKNLKIPYYEVRSLKNMHDWQENMFTKHAKLTLAHFDKYMYQLLNTNKSIIENLSITI